MISLVEAHLENSADLDLHELWLSNAAITALTVLKYPR